jgi:Tfp pilus assembly protein PilX
MRNDNTTMPTSLTAVVASCNRKHRRGVVLVVIMVCLAVAAALFVLVVQQVAAERRAIENGQRTLQAQWLAEAGIERAAARLIADPKYTGETWTIAAAELAAAEGAVVCIRVETVADRPERRSVRVEADYPAASERRCRQVKLIMMDRDAMTSRPRANTPSKTAP